MGRNAKIKAQRRKMLAPGQPASNLPLSVRRSNLTGKWLVILHLPGGPAVISPHYKRCDAINACEIVRAELFKFTIEEIVSGRLWHVFLGGLHYEDDDEILVSPSPESAIKTTQALRERGGLSDAAYLNSMARWAAKKG